ncbi:MAG TPA: ABC transporter permease [Candidatus Sulfopaludibacter sp.]|jgi:predicted permease|nr:ABC transporter permease [Candidatus Sulfopaludibacter sp.]
MGSVFRDIRHAVRSLAGDKGFTITVILTIAVCIAANTATFAVVNSVLLRPLPVPEARSLVLMANRYPKAGADFGYNSATGDYFDRLRDVHVFSEQALFRTNGRTIEIQGTPQRVTGMSGTPSLFRLLRVSPAHGRAFSDAEGETGADQKTILSDGLSRQLFGSPEAALGHDVRIGGQPFTVVGVMPAGFNFIDPEVRLWTPASFTPADHEVHHSNNWQNVGRLKPGATLQQAQAQIDALNRANLDKYPAFRQLLINAGYHTEVVPLEDMLVKEIRGSLYLLWGGAALVLLIGAVNVANLVLARTTLRRKELATRLALGAGTGRLVRQLVTESTLVSLAGGVAGAALGAGLLAALAHSSMEKLPRASEVRVDGTVILAMLLMATVVGIIVGLIPSIQVMRARVNDVLREESRSGTGGKRSRRVRQVLIVAQVGLAFVLLAGAGLLLASFRQLLHVDPGFDVHGVVTASTSVPQSLYPKDSDVRTLMDRTLDAIRSIPGVTAAGATNSIPWGGNHSDSVVVAEGHIMQPGESVISPEQVTVTPGYFEAMHISMLAGRTFDARDRDGALGTVIVDEVLAQRFWPGRNPIGRRMFLPQDPNDLLKTDEHTKWMTVVGVMRPVHTGDVEGSGNPVGAYYLPFAQNVQRGFGLAIKSAGDAAPVLRTVRMRFAAIAPNLALFDVHTMEERGDLALASRRASLTLALFFGGLALFLSAIGIYGVLAYLVTQRQREIGIRTALGCTAGGVVTLIVREAFWLVGLGLVLGGLGSAALRKMVAVQLYGVKPLDPLVMSAVIVTLALVGLAACILPARRATQVDPVIVLRDQ